MHEPVNYDNLWFFIIISIFFFIALVLSMTKIMIFLDKLADRRNKKNEISTEEEKK